MAVRVNGEAQSACAGRKRLFGPYLRKENLFRAAFQEMVGALVETEHPSHRKAQGPSPEDIWTDLEFTEFRFPEENSSSRSSVPNEPPPEGDPARLKWEIEAALEAALPEGDSPPVRLAFTKEEISAALDRVFPEELMRLGKRDSEFEPEDPADSFTISYDFELKCLRAMNRRMGDSQWLPVSILKSPPERN